MATFFVEINAHFLTKIEYDGSCAGAEHYWLDKFTKSVWGANAYDEKAMKTECFRGALLTSELIAQDKLEGLLAMTEERMDDLKRYQQMLADVDKEIADAQKELERLENKRADLVEEMGYPERKFREYVEKSHCTRP